MNQKVGEKQEKPSENKSRMKKIKPKPKLPKIAKKDKKRRRKKWTIFVNSARILKVQTILTVMIQILRNP